MLISHLFPWNLHCMFYWFLWSLHNMDEAVIFIIASLSFIRNEDLEKLCWISLLCSTSSKDIEKLNTFSHPQAVRQKGWMAETSECRLKNCIQIILIVGYALTSETLLLFLSAVRFWCQGWINQTTFVFLWTCSSINKMRWHCFLVVPLPPPLSKTKLL